MTEFLVSSLLLFTLLFAVETFPSWHTSVKINKHFQTELEEALAEARLTFPPFTHSEESE